MQYKISKQELTNINLVIPSWFSSAVLGGADSSELKELIKQNLLSAYEVSGRTSIAEKELDIKVEDLYEVYNGSLEDYRVREK